MILRLSSFAVQSCWTAAPLPLAPTLAHPPLLVDPMNLRDWNYYGMDPDAPDSSLQLIMYQLNTLTML